MTGRPPQKPAAQKPATRQGQSQPVAKPAPLLPPVSALTRPFDVESLREAPERVRFEASTDECATLATENNLPSVSGFKVDLMLTREGKTNILVTGTVRARISQVCVVSLETFETDLLEDVDVRFAPEDEVREIEARAAERDEDEDDEDALPIEPPDAIVDDTIDLGTVAAEFFALGLDPYPRKPGVVFQPPVVADDTAADSPFAALAKLKSEPKT